MCIRRKKKGKEEADPWATRQIPPAPSRQRPADEGDLGIRLRADMLPASHASPRFKAYRPRFTLRKGLTILLVLVMIGLGWYFGIGPGRPGLEKGLTTLIRVARQMTMPTATPMPTETPVPWLPSLTPTSTVTRRPIASATPAIPTSTPTVAPSETPESTCRDFSTVTLEDVGLEMCVQGTVINVVENNNSTLIVFSNEVGAFYLVTYDVIWPDGSEGICYQVTGEIQRLLSNPVIVFGYNNLPEECP
jgi:hypothetical protein